MTLCSACNRELRGTHEDVLVCAETLADEPRIYGMCCAPRELPHDFNQWQSWVLPAYGRPYAGAGPGVRVHWLTPTIIKTGGDK